LNPRDPTTTADRGGAGVTLPDKKSESELSMNRSRYVLIGVVLLAFAGAYISYNLLVKHEMKRTGLSWFDEVCEADDPAVSQRSCDEVVASPWGTFPPIPRGTPTADQEKPQAVPGLPGVTLKPRPVALFGMMYFSVLAAWYIAIGRCDPSRRLWHLVPLGLNTAGVGGAIFFAYIMFFTDLEAWCPWCMVTHVINIVMWFGAVMLWPSGPVEETGAETPPSDTPRDKAEKAGKKRGKPAAPAPATVPADFSRPIAPAHPVGRLVAVTLLMMACVALSESLYHAYAAQFRKRYDFERGFANCEAEIRKVQENAETLFALYQANPKVNIKLRPDDAVKNPGKNRLVAIVFSDFRCPHCARFAKYMTEEIEPMFGENLKVVFRHYPADKGCNKYMPKDKKSMHPGACAASAAAEAARILGGPEAFWKAHDLLFESRRRLGKREFYLEFADTLGLDRKTFVETAASDEVANRINEDIELAREIKMRGTPSLYLSGRKVPSFARSQKVFWKEAKLRFDRLLEMRQRQSKKATGPAKGGATPARPDTPPVTEGSQDQSIAQ
jgi:protein-disulfide isomerase/uncharacterized membrane protein